MLQGPSLDNLLLSYLQSCSNSVFSDKYKRIDQAESRSRGQGLRADQSLESQSAYFQNPPRFRKPVLFRSSRQVSAKLPLCALHRVRYCEDKVLLPVLEEFNNFPKGNVSQSRLPLSPACEPSGIFTNNADS